MNKWEDADWRFPVDERKKEDGLGQISLEIEQKKIRNYPSFWRGILEQMQFQTPGFWICQVLILAAALLFGIYLKGLGEGGLTAMTMVSVFTVIAGSVSINSLNRVFAWHMAELEQTLYLNLKQMVSMHLLLSGVIDLCFLSILIGLLGPSQSEGMGAFAVYLLVPFLWANVCWLQALTAWRGILRGYRQICLGLFCGLMALLPGFIPEVYASVYLPVWGGLFVAGFMGLAAALRRLFRKTEGGDMICLN